MLQQTPVDLVYQELLELHQRMDSRDRLRKVNLNDRGACKCEPNSLPVFRLETMHKQSATKAVTRTDRPVAA